MRYTTLKTLAFLSLVFAFRLSGVFAEIYSYTDEKGNKHFVDDLEKVPAQFKQKVQDSRALPKINKFNFQPPPVAPGKATRNGKVELFLTSWCGYCRSAEAYFKSNNIRFTPRDIEKDPSSKREYEKLGGGGVPIIRIGEHIIHGFDEGAIENALR